MAFEDVLEKLGLLETSARGGDEGVQEEGGGGATVGGVLVRGRGGG